MVETSAAQPVAAPSSDARIPALDGLRGLAILLVMNFHFVSHALQPGFFPRPHTVAVDRISLRIADTGWSGVDLFFVLSGFLITGILYDSRGRAARYFRTFYGRRVLRIFPVYYALLIALMLLVPVIVPQDRYAVDALVEHRFWYYTFMSNIRPLFGPPITPDFTFTAPFWSLAVEEQFYLIWPAVVLLIGRRGGLLRVCAVAMIAAPLLRLTLDLSGADRILATSLTPARMDALAVGAAVALIARDPGGLARLGRFAGPVAAVTGVTLLALYFARDGLPSTDIWVQTLGFTALAFFWGSLLVRVLLATPASILSVMFGNSVLRWFGRYSYALYLFHLSVAVFVEQRVDFPSTVMTVLGSRLPGAIVYWVVAGGISATAAFVSWHLIEKPFLDLKSAFPYGSASTVVEPS